MFEFLGADPFPKEASTFGEQVKLYRRMRGLSIKKLAKEWGIDPTTLARWESKNGDSSEKLKETVSRITEGSNDIRHIQ